MDVPNYYAILEVDRHASARQISRAFRRLAFIHHPDLNKAPTAEATFKLINQAYQILSDAEARTHYNLIWDEVYQGHAPTSDHGDESSAQDEKTRQERVTRDQMSHSPATGAGVVRDTRYWLRWAAVLPASVAISLFIHFWWLGLPNWLGADSTGLVWVAAMGGLLMSMAGGIIGGSYVAPEKKFQTAIALVMLRTLLIGISWELYTLLEIFVHFTGLSLGLYYVHENAKKGS